MTTLLNPYLSFKDNAREAMDFYHTVFGGELTQSTFEEMNAVEDPADKDKIMHASLKTEAGLNLMGSDTPSSMGPDAGGNGSISLSGEDETELRGYWDKLSSGGTIAMPMETAPWGDSFGMCVDRFGVSWMVNIAGAPA